MKCALHIRSLYDPLRGLYLCQCGRTAETDQQRANKRGEFYEVVEPSVLPPAPPQEPSGPDEATLDARYRVPRKIKKYLGSNRPPDHTRAARRKHRRLKRFYRLQDIWL